MTRTLKTVPQFASDSPFTESSLRWMIFNEHDNGLAKAGAVIRIGRRVFIDPAAFERWVDAQQRKVDAP